MDLSFNYFEGPLPSFHPGTVYIDLSNNNFAGILSSLCNFSEIAVLDLSDNYLSGELPQCWKEKSHKDLSLLGLSNNNLTGNVHNWICSSIGSLLKVLLLSNNGFTGELPSSLSNCTGLSVLDVASNMFSGSIPEWIGNSLRDLRILILRSNRFSGPIPLSLCRLQSLQIIDVFRNNLTGYVLSCLHNSTALSGKALSPYFDPVFDKYIYGPIYDVNVTNVKSFIAAWRFHLIQFGLTIMWKRMEHEYKRNLGTMIMLDFSSNKLHGEIPEELGSLVGLLQLNLSTNNLVGRIPKRIGEMSKLEAPDLSSNHLSGEIPQSISNLNFLATLDLSNNLLTGQIPTGTQIQTQSEASFMGNSGLCGEPLPKKCHQEAPTSIGHKDEDDDGFFISMAVGFVVGLWGVSGVLLYHDSWSFVCLRFLINLVKWVYVRW